MFLSANTSFHNAALIQPRFETNITQTRLDPLIQSATAVSMSTAFLLVFLLFAFIIGVVMLRVESRKHMNKNQVLMILLILILSLIQCLVLVSRDILDLMNIRILSQYESYIARTFQPYSMEFRDTFQNRNCSIRLLDAGIPMEEIVVMYLFESCELFFVIVNLTLMIVIMCFVGNVFLNTVKKATGLEHEYSKARRLILALNVWTCIVSVILVFIAFSSSISYFFYQIAYIPYIYQTILLVIAFITYVFQLIIQTIHSNYVALMTLNVIQRNTSSLNHLTEHSKQAIVKIVVLQCGLTGCALMQIAALAFACAVDEFSYLVWFYGFLNSLGILLFACIGIVLYHPIFAFRDQPQHKKEPTTPKLQQHDVKAIPLHSSVQV